MLINYFKTSVLSFLNLLDRLIPKNEVFSFYKTPRTSWDANQQALYQYLLQNTNETIIVLDGNKLSKYKPLQSMKIFWGLIRSKVIIFDHSIPVFLKSKKHIRVNLWHGTPLKKIRSHLKDDESLAYAEVQAGLIDLLVSNSNYDALLMSSVMGSPRYKVLDTGLPRNDFLLCDQACLDKIDLYGDFEKLKLLKANFSKVILWAPTYRGKPKDLKNPLELTLIQQKQLCNLLEKTNTILWLRVHKFSKVTNLDYLLNHPNVSNVTNIINSNIVLRFVDVLVTDFSSIWIDYLLLNKPIIIYAQDYEAYKINQGFILNFKEQIPVGFLNDFDDLIAQIGTVLNQDNFVGYCDAKVKFHHHDFSANKTELVYKAIKNFKRLSFSSKY